MFSITMVTRCPFRYLSEPVCGSLSCSIELCKKIKEKIRVGNIIRNKTYMAVWPLELYETISAVIKASF